MGSLEMEMPNSSGMPAAGPQALFQQHISQPPASLVLQFKATPMPMKLMGAMGPDEFMRVVSRVNEAYVTHTAAVVGQQQELLQEMMRPMRNPIAMLPCCWCCYGIPGLRTHGQMFDHMQNMNAANKNFSAAVDTIIAEEQPVFASRGIQWVYRMETHTSYRGGKHHRDVRPVLAVQLSPACLARAQQSS